MITEIIIFIIIIIIAIATNNRLLGDGVRRIGWYRGRRWWRRWSEDQPSTWWSLSWLWSEYGSWFAWSCGRSLPIYGNRIIFHQFHNFICFPMLLLFANVLFPDYFWARILILWLNPKSLLMWFSQLTQLNWWRRFPNQVLQEQSSWEGIIQQQDGQCLRIEIVGI